MSVRTRRILSSAALLVEYSEHSCQGRTAASPAADALQPALCESPIPWSLLVEMFRARKPVPPPNSCPEGLPEGTLRITAVTTIAMADGRFATKLDVTSISPLQAATAAPSSP